MTRKILLAVMLLLLPSVPALADVAALSYLDPYGESRIVAPSQQYINPAGEVGLYLTGGLDRKVGYVLKDAGGQTVAEGVSGLITPSDTLTVLGQTHYGKVLTVPATLTEGSYTLTGRILDNAGNVVASQNVALVVDRTPPTAGDLWWYAWGYNGSIMNNELVGTFESKYIQVHDVSDDTGIGQVQFESFYPDSGEVYKSAAAWYDAAAGTAGIGTGVNYCIGSNYLPVIDGPLGVRFIIYDRAGNKTVAQATVRFDGQKAPDPELIAIYNPNVATEFIPGSGLVGFEAYTPGMASYANPVQVLYRLVRSNWAGDNPDYGLVAQGGVVVYTDSQYVYYKFTVPHSNYPQSDLAWRFRSSRMSLTHYVQFNVVLAESAPRSPVLVSWETYQSDIGWSGLTGGTLQRLFNTPVVISKIRAVVEPRNYPQVFVDPGSGSCTIPAGETECTLNTNITKPPGTTSYYHTYCYVKKDDGSLRSPVKYTLFMYDLQSPAITSYNLDRGNKKITFWADEPSAGTIWGHVRLTSGWVMAHNPATSQEVQVNGTVTGLGGTTYQIQVNYASLPEGEWHFTLWAQDRFGNTASQAAETVVLDNTSPVIQFFKNAAAMADHDGTDSLGKVSFTVTDNVDQTPQVESVRLTGGPQNANVYLAYHDHNGAYVLEYPVLYPSNGQEYTLAVTARDASGNQVTRQVAFSYNPPTVPLASAQQGTRTCRPSRRRWCILTAVTP